MAQFWMNMKVNGIFNDLEWCYGYRIEAMENKISWRSGLLSLARVE